MAGVDTDEADAPSRPATVVDVLRVSGIVVSDAPSPVGTVLIGGGVVRLVFGAVPCPGAVLGPGPLSQPARGTTPDKATKARHTRARSDQRLRAGWASLMSGTAPTGHGFLSMAAPVPWPLKLSSNLVGAHPVPLTAHASSLVPAFLDTHPLLQAPGTGDTRAAVA